MRVDVYGFPTTEETMIGGPYEPPEQQEPKVEPTYTCPVCAHDMILEMETFLSEYWYCPECRHQIKTAPTE